jgi:dihydropteroate synthase
MAIINTSPDSFSGDGVSSESKIAERINQAVAEGADILDIGGQSTRPGAAMISEDEEIARIVPAIRIAREISELPISIDTFKPAVAEAALTAGATILNDIHGGQDAKIAEVAARHTAEVVVMHSRGTAETMSQLTDYPGGVVNEVMDFLKKQTDQFIAAGIPKDKLIIDPGIGFAKTAQQSFELTRALEEFKQLGFRVLYGASRKSFLGKALADTAGEPLPASERLAATIVTTTYALLHGADVIRVHDVRAAVEARRIVACISNPSLIG